jgi:hypothetical protein
MIERCCAFLCALLLAACAIRAPSPEAFFFGVMGDTPYSDREEAHFLKMMERMNAEPLAFVVHVGDFKAGGNSPCTDALFEKRRAQFDGSAHPLIYTPGDNEWTDCRRPGNGGFTAIDRLAKLRQLFFADALSLGRERIQTEVQGGCVEAGGATCTCAGLPENRMWTRAGVRFVTLNFAGKGNNEGYDRANDEEARCRNQANRRWLERAVSDSANDSARALVVITQANPWIGVTTTYDPFLRQVREAAGRLRRPVLLVHGDTHLYRVDAPFKDSMDDPLPNLTRLEVYGSPTVGWVKVKVDPGFPDLFRFEPHVQAIVP